MKFNDLDDFQEPPKAKKLTMYGFWAEACETVLCYKHKLRCGLHCSSPPVLVSTSNRTSEQQKQLEAAKETRYVLETDSGSKDNVCTREHVQKN